MSGTFAVPTRPWRWPHVDGLPTVTAAVGVAGVLALLAITLGWRGSDLPAQIFRADLFRQDGFVLWNSQWFGGHAVLGYSVIAPAISALFGPVAVGALSGIASAFVFERILRRAFGSIAWLGSLWFALATVINLIVGRTTYALGVALALGAIYALQHRRAVVAVGFAVLCSLASPLAGCFLAIVAVVWAASQRAQRTQALAMFVAAVVPIATFTLLFPTAGSAALPTVGIRLGPVPLPHRRDRAAQVHGGASGAACFAFVATCSFLVPTALWAGM